MRCYVCCCMYEIPSVWTNEIRKLRMCWTRMRENQWCASLLGFQKALVIGCLVRVYAT